MSEVHLPPDWLDRDLQIASAPPSATAEIAALRARVAELEASRARLAASVRAADNVKVCLENLGGDANTADLLVFYCLAKEANDQYDAARAALTEADLA